MDVKLRIIRLRNCQSWKDCNISLADGLNVICADNNTGKSVLFKLLKASVSPSYYSKDELQQLIRYGTEFAEATYIFSDGSVAVVRIFKQRVIYYYTPDFNSQGYTQQEGIPHAEILEQLSVIVEPSSGFIANVLDLDQSLLLVNSKSTSDYDLIKVLTHNEDLTRLAELFKNKLVTYKAELTDVRKTQARLEHVLETLEYVDIEYLEDTIDKSEKLYALNKSLVLIYEELNQIQISDTKIIDYDTVIPLLDLGQKLKEINNIELEDTGVKVDDKLINLCTMVLDMKELYRTICDVEILPDIDNDLYLIHSSLVDVYQEISRIEELPNIDRVDQILCDINLLDNLKAIFNEVVNYGQEVEKQEDLLDTINSYKEQLNIEGKELDCPIHGRIKYINNQCIPVG